MRVPESYKVRAVIHCTQIDYSVFVTLAAEANTAVDVSSKALLLRITLMALLSVTANSFA
jgi:hypothetical protein